MKLVRTVATAAALLIGVTSTEAQSPNDAKSAIDRKADIGNRLTITTADGTDVMGRLLRLDGEHLVLQQETGERTFRARLIGCANARTASSWACSLALAREQLSDGLSRSCRPTKAAPDLMESGSHLRAWAPAWVSMPCLAVTLPSTAPLSEPALP